uniref:Ty3/gypsy retrotransposon protein n=1 Tax=Tanacetum cinerariifolium TaxID=118510 RepID=A0A6L2JRB6_TANCI|nr:Ty3/gypsy retrotransposon protein [Tanacetum cinerariifolium]
MDDGLGRGKRIKKTPATLGDAFALGQITEACLEDQAALVTGVLTKPATSVGTQRQPTGPSKLLAIKWISLAERQERLNKGMCFSCENRWERGHKCSSKFLLLITDEEDDSGAMTLEVGDDAVESGDILILNSLIGHGSLRVQGIYCSGETLLCESVCSNSTVHMQGVTIKVDLYVLRMQGLDVISLHQMQALLDQDGIYRVYEVHSFTKEIVAAEIQAERVTLEHPELTPLLKRFDSYSRSYYFKSRSGDGSLEDEIPAGLAEAYKLASVGEREASASDSLKQQLATTPILRLPNFDQMFVVKDDASDNAELFLEIVIKHHGIPKTIVSDRDPIFVSKVWTQLFQLSGMQLNQSTTYHPQSDGQTKVVNWGLEQYLRAMVSDRPQQWRFCGPYTKVERIGKVSYRLALPSTSKSHPVFHVSILKLFLVNGGSAATNLPEELQEGHPLEKPMAIHDLRMVLRNGS